MNQQHHSIRYPFAGPLLGAFHSARQAAGDAPFRVDIEDDEQEYRIVADLPGAQKKDIALGVEEDVLTISADYARAPDDEKSLRRERLSGRLERRFLLSRDVQGDGISASLKDGVLTVTLPKGDSARLRKIAIA